MATSLSAIVLLAGQSRRAKNVNVVSWVMLPLRGSRDCARLNSLSDSRQRPWRRRIAAIP